MATTCTGRHLAVSAPCAVHTKAAPASAHKGGAWYTNQGADFTLRVWILSVVHTCLFALFPLPDVAERLPGDDAPKNAERGALGGGE